VVVLLHGNLMPQVGTGVNEFVSIAQRLRMSGRQAE